MVSEVQRNSAAAPTTPPPIVGGRHLITAQLPGLPEATVRPERPASEETDADTAIPGLDVRNATPRQISDVSLDLYAAGMLTYEDYTALAFQPELHPD
ncbi:MAG: hypothetical protein VW338_06865 [Rhodospirillaceae bacterium]